MRLDHASGAIGVAHRRDKMSDGRDIIALVAQRQDCEQFRRKNWVGTFAEYLDIVREHPEVTRTAYQRLYDMILSYGVDVTETGREKHVHYRFFDDPGQRRPRRRLRPRRPAAPPGQRAQERGGRLRHRTPRAAAARPRGQQQEHDRPAAEERPGALLGDRRRRALHARLGRRRTIRRTPRRFTGAR